MISFSVVVLDVLRYRPPEMSFPDWNQPIQAFFFDRPHEAFRVGVGIGRALGDEDHADSRVPESPPHITAPLPIPIADQNVQRVQHLYLLERLFLLEPLMLRVTIATL